MAICCCLAAGAVFLFRPEARVAPNDGDASTVSNKNQSIEIDSPESKPEYSLPDDEREYLWKLEHHGNILGKFGFSRFNSSWQARDRAGLLAVINEQLNGSIVGLNAEAELANKTDLVDAQRIKATESSKQKVNRGGFADWLLSIRVLFADEPAPRCKFYVKQITPPGDDETDGLWDVVCNFRTWGKAKDGGPIELTTQMSLEVHDISKERMAEDGWIQSVHVQQIDAASSTGPLFADVTAATKIDTDSMHDNWRDKTNFINTGGLYACDYNRDGLTDILITDLEMAGTQFLVGQPDGTFRNELARLGLGRVAGATVVAFVDLDNDGWEDLVLPREGGVFRNLDGITFSEMSAGTNLSGMILSTQAPPHSISSVIPLDFNRDGMMDVYVTRAVPPVGSWLEDKQPAMVPNQLLINKGNFRFEDVTTKVNAGGGGLSCFSGIVTDVNNDRWPDIYLINEFGNGALLLNNEGRKFTEQSLIDAQQDFGSMGQTCGDVNNDGNIDIYVSNMYSKAGSRIMGNMIARDYPKSVQQRLRSMVAGGELYSNQGDLKFDPVGKQFQIHAAGWAWGAALADLNNDGWLDLHVTAGFISRDRNKPDG